MTGEGHAGAQDVFHEAFASVRHAFLTAGIFSLFINVLMLAGPLYMLQVYDRVLTSQSLPTLVALTLLLVVLYAALGLLEAARGQILNRVAGRLDRMLGPATLETIARHRLETGDNLADEPLRDLAVLRQFLSGAGPAAFFDVPWTPIFLAITFVIDWSLGAFALAAAGLMIVLAVLNEASTKALLRKGKLANDFATRLAMESGRNTEAMVAMGMTESIVDRWRYVHEKADDLLRRAGDRMVAFATATRTLRLFVQSGLLGIGAVLAIKQIITPGMMIAVSIIGGRALAPVGQAVAQWRGLLGAREAFARLKTFHRYYPAERPKMSLPPPQGRIELRRLCAAPPGLDRPVLKDISFKLDAGETLGVLGPSAAGKSTLAHVLLGLWQPQSGAVHLDGSDLQRLEPDGNWSQGRLPAAERRIVRQHDRAEHLALATLTPRRRRSAAPLRGPQCTITFLRCLTATICGSAKAAAVCPPGSGNASAWRAPFTATPLLSSSMNRTPISTPPARRRCSIRCSP